MSTNKKLIKSTGIIGFATLSSRLLGFVRDILFANFFGTDIYAQAFVVAYRIPNMLRDMVGEGATNAAIVPILTEYKHKHTDSEYWEAARVILNMLLVVLVVLIFFGILFAPLIVRMLAPGFLNDAEKFNMAVTLTRYIFPYIFFLGLLAYCKGVLNSFQFFTTPALSPVILNISLVLSLWFLCPIIGIKGLVIGILFGGLLQVSIQIPELVKRGFRIKMQFQLIHSVAGRVGKLLLPRLVGTAVYQLSVLIDTVLASLAWIVGAGGVAALYYSQRLIQLPLAIFGISLATAVLPRMSKEVAANDVERLKSTIRFSLNTVFSIMIPASFGLIILSTPIIQTLFQRGEFTDYSTAITTNALFFYSFGLFAYAGIKILVNTYYSMGDTRTPVRTAAVSLLINIILNLILMWPLKIGGLALATSIAAVCNFFMLYIILIKRIGDVGTSSIVYSFLKVCLAAVIMSCFTAFVRDFFIINASSDIMAFIYILFAIFFSFIVYLIAAFLCGVSGVRKFWVAVSEKLSELTLRR